jgi:RHS repeat-associated protein
VTDTYTYDAFGNLTAHTGTTVNPFLYRGEQYDSTLGMYYLRARYYRPQIGRFLTADKYEDGQGPGCACTCACSCSGRDDAKISPSPSHHLYVYTNDDPVNFVDPSGLELWIYKQLQAIQRGLGLQAHHLIEQRFAVTLLRAGCLLNLATCISVTPAQHQNYTCAWRAQFPYGEGTACATPNQIILFAMILYQNHPEILDWLRGL